jgi:hypothetical protein
VKRSNPHGCQGIKRYALGPLIEQVLVAHNGIPRFAQISLLRVDSVVLIAVPFEMTTIAGRRLTETVRSALLSANLPSSTAIVGLANGYLSYLATAEEYEQQDYEGASTMFGPGTSGALNAFARERVADLGAGAPALVEPIVLDPFPIHGAQGRMSLLDQGPANVHRDIQRESCLADTLALNWIDLSPGRVLGAGGPVLQLEGRRSGQTSIITWDDDAQLEVRPLRAVRNRGYLWRASWFGHSTVDEMRFVLLGRQTPEATLPPLAGPWVRVCTH